MECKKDRRIKFRKLQTFVYKQKKTSQRNTETFQKQMK